MRLIPASITVRGVFLVSVVIVSARTASAAPTAAQAQAFVTRAETDLAAEGDLLSRAAWVQAMLRLGQSKPWPEALAAFSGEHDIDARAINDYFAPLSRWLDQQNKANSCQR